MRLLCSNPYASATAVVLAVLARALRTAAPLGLLAISGCGCNLIGCADGLRVQLATMPVGAFQVELLVSGAVQPAPAEATCDGVKPCFQTITFQTRARDNVSVRVSTASGERVTNLPRISYDASRPNGKGCDPVCYNASVTVPIP